MALASCAVVVPRAEVDVTGRLEVLGPHPQFSPARPGRGWVASGLDGSPRGVRLAVERKNGVPSLRVESGEARALLLRHTKAALTVTPYLSWAWNMEPTENGGHPVQLMIGFHGGDPNSRSWGASFPRWTGKKLPPHDRSLSLVWEASALRRGHLTVSGDGRDRHGVYTVRGGGENAGVWHLETVDLSELYSRAWPDDDLGRTRIMFVGVAVEPNAKPAAAFISGIVLSR